MTRSPIQLSCEWKHFFVPATHVSLFQASISFCSIHFIVLVETHEHKKQTNHFSYTDTRWKAVALFLNKTGLLSIKLITIRKTTYVKHGLNLLGLSKAKLYSWYKKDCVGFFLFIYISCESENNESTASWPAHRHGDRHNNNHFDVVTAVSLFTKCEASRENCRRRWRWHCCREQMTVFQELAALAVHYQK